MNTGSSSLFAWIFVSARGCLAFEWDLVLRENPASSPPDYKLRCEAVYATPGEAVAAARVMAARIGATITRIKTPISDERIEAARIDGSVAG